MTEHHDPTKLARAKSSLGVLPGVRDASVLKEDPRTDSHIVEITVGPKYDRVPPRVLRLLAQHDLGIHDVTTRGEPVHHIVVAL